MNEANLDDGGSLGRRIVHGGAWLSALLVTEQLLGVVRLVVVARLLTPADLGLFGMALLTIAVYIAVTETGIEAALIQRRRLTDTVLDVAWTASVVRSVLVAALLFSTAGFLAGFFREPSVAPVTRVLGVTVLLNGLTSISVVLLKRRMEFHKYFAYQVSGLVCEVSVTILLALVWRNVWALVAGLVTGAVVRLAVSYLIAPRRPRVTLRAAELSSLFEYGKWLTVSSVLILLLVQGDDIFVGRVFGVAMLGFYQMAYKISNLPATGIAGVLASLLFPAYSSVQDNVERLSGLYLRAVRLTAALALPVSALIASLSREFTATVLGPKWLPMVPLLVILVAYGALRTMGATTGPVFLALGRPDIRTKIQVGQLVILVVSIYPLAMAFGAAGVAASVTLYALVFNSVAVWKATRLCEQRLSRVARAVALPAIASAGAMAAMAAFETHVPVGTGAVKLLAAAAVGALAYLALMAVADRIERGLYREELGRLVSSLTGAARAGA